MIRTSGLVGRGRQSSTRQGILGGEGIIGIVDTTTTTTHTTAAAATITHHHAHSQVSHTLVRK